MGLDMNFIFNEDNKDIVINLDKVSAFTKANVDTTSITFYLDSSIEYWDFKTEDERDSAFENIKNLINAKEVKT